MKFKIWFIDFDIKWWLVAIYTLSLVLSIFNINFLTVALLYTALLFHELGHACVGKIVDGAPAEIDLYGVIHGTTRSYFRREMSRGEKIAFLLTGPIVGILFGVRVLLISLFLHLEPYFALSAVAIVLTHAWNLLPIKEGSDGIKLSELFQEGSNGTKK